MGAANRLYLEAAGPARLMIRRLPRLLSVGSAERRAGQEIPDRSGRRRAVRLGLAFRRPARNAVRDCIPYGRSGEKP